MEIKRVLPEDAEVLLAIYAPYVTDTAVSFEYEVPSVEEFRQRIETISAKYPYLKAVEDGVILGYAYAGAFHSRRAYDWSVETTVYVRQDCQGRGIGKALYRALEASLRAMNIRNMNACIAVPNAPDAHLSEDSPRFHAHMGFILVGRFHNSGYKFGTWYDMIWMENLLTQDAEETPPPVRFGEWALPGEQIDLPAT